MSGHWRLAAGGAALTVLLSLVGAVITAVFFGGTEALGFLYGAGVGVVIFSLIAVTASLLSGKLSGGRVLLGVAVYFGRLMVAAAAIGGPILLGSWPALPMICGFVGVYVVENVVLLVGAWRARGAVGRGSPRVRG